MPGRTLTAIRNLPMLLWFVWLLPVVSGSGCSGDLISVYKNFAGLCEKQTPSWKEVTCVADGKTCCKNRGLGDKGVILCGRRDENGQVGVCYTHFKDTDCQTVEYSLSIDPGACAPSVDQDSVEVWGAQLEETSNNTCLELCNDSCDLSPNSSAQHFTSLLFLVGGNLLLGVMMML